MIGPRGAAIFAAICMLALVGAGTGIVTVTSARAASPEPQLNPDISMTAEPMLGGKIRPGAWLAIRVALENSGPAVDAELRLSTPRRVSSNYSLAVQLAAGARQEHFLYAPTDLFTGRVDVSLVSGEAVLATAPLALANAQPESLFVSIVAERSEQLVRPIRETLTAGGRAPPEIASIRPEDLPARVEAWSSIDLLVWQDVDSGRLEPIQLEAMRAWLTLGGDLLILGGTTGGSSLNAWPQDVLPYRPVTTVEATAVELDPMLAGAGLPPGTGVLPALAGPLDRGELLAGTDGSALAARSTHGLGSVTLIGLNPVAGWLSGPAEGSFWRNAIPSSASTPEPRLPADDTFLINALANVPSVQLPRGDHLFLLILAYIVAIGPLNYFILRRRDKREWAWLTIPLTIVGFALAGYFFGVVLRGGSVFIHELAIVQGAAGSEQGVADVHVAIYSPGRVSFDVRVAGAPLLGVPSANNQPSERPLDVLLGSPATLRGYDISFGALRSFRATAQVATPSVDADLRLAGGAVEGTVTNTSSVTLADVSLVYAGAFQRLGDLPPGASRTIRLPPAQWHEASEGLTWRMYGWDGEPLAGGQEFAYRRAAIQHLEGGWDAGIMSGGVFSRGPTILAWVSQSALEVDVGSPAEKVGETLYLLAARAELERGEAVFAGSLLAPVSVSVDAVEGWAQGGWFTLHGGTLTIDYRPPSFEGSFAVSDLLIKLDPEGPQGRAVELRPLPADQQPDPDAPLASGPQPGFARGIPRFQLYDRLAGTWLEFEPIDSFDTYRIPDPARYVDSSGAFRVRFVVGHDDYVDFGFGARLEGTLE